MPKIVAAVKVVAAVIKASKIFAAVKAVLTVVSVVSAIVNVTKKTPKGSTQRRQADVLQITLGEGPREVIFGQAATGGSLEDVFNWGTTNEWEVQVITVADHACDSVVGYFVGDRFVAWTADGVQSGFSNALEIYRFTGGLSGTALTYLTTNSGGRWTNSDVLSGCDGFVVAYKYDEKVWPTGRPQFKFVMRGIRCYDPRKDSTVPGGSGAHRWGSPGTYEWTENAAICRYNYVRGIFTNGQLLVGPGRSAVESPPEFIIGPANVCDELVSLRAGGTEARYRVGCVVASTEQWLNVEEKFAEAMAGDIVERAGTLFIDVGAAKSSVFSFSDDDLVYDGAVITQAKIGRRDLVNTVAYTFVDPTKLWQAVAGPLRRSAADIAIDGEPRELTLEFEFVTSSTQAQRIAEIARRKARLQRQATVTLGPEAMLLEAGDWVTWTSLRYAGGQTRLFVVTSVELSDDLRTTLQLREIGSAVYAWTPATDELDNLAPAYLPSGSLPAASIANFNASAVAITGGGSAVPAISCTWTPPNDPSIFAVTLEWRQVGSLDSIRLSYGRPNEGALIVAAGITASTNYEIRITPETEPERIETPSAWRQITSGALQTAVAGSITGQGVLATRNFVQLGTSANLMFAENGSTVLTNATVITAQGTAASITGQGSLATRNSVDLATADVVNKTGNNIQYSAGIGGGSLDSLRPAQVNADRTAVNTAAAISGQGTLATRNGVQLGSTAGVMYQENGTTVLTNASVVTSLGTAAGIVGQGPLATASLVATANIANAAVTNSSAFSGGVVFLTANAWHDIAEVNITSSGGSIDIIGLASVFLSDSDANLNIEMQIVRDAAVVNASGTVAQAVFYASGTLNIYRAIGTGALGALDVPASGLRTYRLQIRGNSSGIAPTFAIYSRSLRCLELKR